MENLSSFEEYRPTSLFLSIPTICTVTFNTVTSKALSAVSLLTMTTISADRFVALLLGLRYRPIVTLRRFRASVALFYTVILGFIVATIPKFPLGKLYNLTLIAFCIFIPCFVISNLFYLRQNQDQTQLPGQPDGEEISFNVARYKKTVATVFWI